MRARWLEDVGVVAVAVAATLHAEWRIVSNSFVFQTDAQIHEFWMRRFQDPGLFDDALTNSLLATGYEPPAFQALYWIASHIVDPVFFGELLPLVLQPLAVLLVFRIVREQTDWRPGAWLGAALFLVPWEIHRFSGGHPRAFAQVIVLLTVFLLLRRRNAVAALVPPVGALLYPPASLVALAVVLLSALERRRRFLLDRGRALWSAASVLAFAAAALGPRLVSGTGDLITSEEARRFAEFGRYGQMHYFTGSTLDGLKQNYSGFFLETPGSLLAVSAVLLLVVRPRNARLLRWEVWSVAIAALALFAIAHALIFRLYLPHRYTYPLLPFFCIAIGVTLRPTLQAWADRSRLLLAAAFLLPLALALLALTVFPLGPQWSVSEFGSWLGDARWYLAVGLTCGLALATLVSRRAGAAGAAAAVALLAGSLLVAETTFAGGGRSPGAVRCRYADLYSYLRTLPKDAVVAGVPEALDCIPIAARRPVLISRKLYQPWEREYFREIRPRMFGTVDALYGASLADVVALRTRFDADYLLVPAELPERWPRMAPFSRKVRKLGETVSVPAVRRLPASCSTWRDAKLEVFSLACVADESSR